jgi:anthranilate/para-aminobenzoate synthase component II
VIKPDTLSGDFVVCAWSAGPHGREIMAVRHKSYPLFGLQFHPESFLTDCGSTLLARFLAVKPPKRRNTNPNR